MSINNTVSDRVPKKKRGNKAKSVAYHAMWWAVRGSLAFVLSSIRRATMFIEDDNTRAEIYLSLMHIEYMIICLARCVSGLLGYKRQMNEHYAAYHAHISARSAHVEVSRRALLASEWHDYCYNKKP